MVKPLPLSDLQKQECVRLRRLKLTYKQIARSVNCTPDQVKGCCSRILVAGFTERRRLIDHKSKWNTRGKLRAEKRQQVEQTKAQTSLAQEIALARVEALTAPLYKNGALEW